MDPGRNVVDNLLRRRRAERVALMDSPWAETIAAWVAQGYPTKMVPKKKGEKRWCREDGRWDDVTIDGEYEEPVSVWQHFGYPRTTQPNPRTKAAMRSTAFSRSGMVAQ